MRELVLYFLLVLSSAFVEMLIYMTQNYTTTIIYTK